MSDVKRRLRMSSMFCIIPPTLYLLSMSILLICTTSKMSENLDMSKDFNLLLLIFTILTMLAYSIVIVRLMRVISKLNFLDNLMV